ncbi:MAG: hypothetical protein IKW88_00945, partial [Clostridiales bacterium]|nr:hypothetical protein [Clostridiales bacterium]
RSSFVISAQRKEIAFPAAGDPLSLKTGRCRYGHCLQICLQDCLRSELTAADRDQDPEKISGDRDQDPEEKSLL